MRNNIKLFVLISCIRILFPSLLHATHGYFANGFGTKSIGMGGVATAYPQETLVSATNPAGMVRLENQIDVGGQAFMPFRKYAYTGTTSEQLTIPKDCVASDSNVFAVASMGISYKLGENDSIGLAIYGNGGINTNYIRANPIFGGRGPINTPLNRPLAKTPMGLNLLQLIAAPTYAHTFDCKHPQSLGIAPLIAVQAFKAKGLYGFATESLSSNICAVTNNEHDVVPAGGVRFGWLGSFCNLLHIGASYSTKLYARRFKNYAGLLAEQGKFNIPAVLNAGLALTDIVDGLVFAFDYQRIFYGGIPSISNSIGQFGLPINLFAPDVTNKLGEKCGPGFGWQNINVFKVGVSYQPLKWFIMRAGYSHGDIPYDPAKEIDANLTAPAVVQDHITLGATMMIQDDYELDIAYGHAFRKKVCGASVFQLGIVTHEMRQHFVNINLSFKF